MNIDTSLSNITKVEGGQEAEGASNLSICGKCHSDRNIHREDLPEDVHFSADDHPAEPEHLS